MYSNEHEFGIKNKESGVKRKCQFSIVEINSVFMLNLFPDDLTLSQTNKDNLHSRNTWIFSVICNTFNPRN